MLSAVLPRTKHVGRLGAQARGVLFFLSYFTRSVTHRAMLATSPSFFWNEEKLTGRGSVPGCISSPERGTRNKFRVRTARSEGGAARGYGK